MLSQKAFRPEVNRFLFLFNAPTQNSQAHHLLINKTTRHTSSQSNQDFTNNALARFKALRRFDKTPYYVNDYHEINDVYSSSGSMRAMPKWYRFGLLKVMANIIFFIGIGAFISKKAVNFLEENDIFKPEGDDDDEDED